MRRRISRRRLPNWEYRLFSWLKEKRGQALAYGHFDCVTGLACGAVEAITGEMLGLEHVAKYTTEKSAYKYMRRQGWNDLEHMADCFLRRAPRGDRHRGNILLMENIDGARGFGIRAGNRAIAFGPEGLREFYIPAHVKEWSPV